MDDELAWLDALAQADLVRGREVSPLELVDAAVATGLVAVAHANDGTGSIRIPASAWGWLD